tara:strand:- start:28 stop:564 length:537 start_codon:yes stop_codon:yes gene_type:complete
MVGLHRSIFLDRDGVIVKSKKIWGKPFAVNLYKEFKFDNYAKKGIVSFKKIGFKIIIVTNQPDYSSKKLALSELNKMHHRIFNELKVDDIYTCLHARKMQCKCRKPNTKMILKSVIKYNIDLSKSYLIGDRKSDIDLANKLNLRSVFIDHNYIERKPSGQIKTTNNFENAVKYITSIS